MTYLSPVEDTVPQAKGTLPHVIRAREPDFVPFVDWLEAHRDEVLASLAAKGAVLIRGVDAGTPERFERIVRTITPGLQDDYLGTSPRDAVTSVVHEASGLPGYYPIPEHCEMTFVATPPSQLFFGCVLPPRRFGETPLVDMRAVAAAMDPDILAAFRAGGIRIIRNYAAPGQRGGMMQLKPWAEMFGTTDKDVVTARAEAEGFEVTWTPGDGLRLENVQPPTKPHPVSGAETWFNHLQVFHVSTAAAEYRRIFRRRPSLRNLAVWGFSSALVQATRLGTTANERAMHVTYADRSPIPEAHVEHVRDVIWDHLVAIPWQRGDVIAIDNHAVAHGRLPYTGPRRIVVAWA